MVKNGFNEYLRSKILTASKAELTLMLYDGCIKFCNIAAQCMRDKDIEGANTNVKKAEAIIDEFLITLDHKYPVAADFEKVYTYCKKRLIEANIKKDPAIVEEVLDHMRVMRETWKQVMALTANGAKAPAV